MAYIVTNHIFHKQYRYQYADNRIDKKQVIAFGDVEMRSQRPRYEMYQSLENKRGKAADNTYYQRQDNNKRLLLDVLFAPQQKGVETVEHTLPKCSARIHLLPYYSD